MNDKNNSPDFRPIRILLIEDNTVDARLLELLLEEQTSRNAIQHNWVRVEELSDGLAKLAAERFDVILLDLSLPDSQGLETFQKARAAARETPILVLSGTDDDTLALRAVREGAQDYLVKGRTDGYLLSRAINFAIARKHTQQKLENIGALAAGVARELRNPLAAISTSVNFLTANLSGTDEKVTQVLKEMKEAIDRVHGIAQDLQDFESGRQ